VFESYRKTYCNIFVLRFAFNDCFEDSIDMDERDFGEFGDDIKANQKDFETKRKDHPYNIKYYIGE